MEQSNCQQCGKCCKELTSKDFWIENSNLTEEEQNLLKNEKLKYVEDFNYCDMLVEEGGLYYCLVEKVLGRDRKPEVCLSYPGGSLCIKAFEDIEQQKLQEIEDARQEYLKKLEMKINPKKYKYKRKSKKWH